VSEKISESAGQALERALQHYPPPCISASDNGERDEIPQNYEDAEANGSIASHIEGKRRQKHENKASATQKNSK
jgi:hypothetical protein